MHRLMINALIKIISHMSVYPCVNVRTHFPERRTDVMHVQPVKVKQKPHKDGSSDVNIKFDPPIKPIFSKKKASFAHREHFYKVLLK